MTERRLQLLLTAAALCLLAGPAHAQEVPDIPFLHDIFVSLRKVSDTMNASIGTALGTAQISRIINVLFASLATLLFVWKFSGFALRGFDLMEILELMFTIFYVYLFLTAYRTLIPGIAEAGRFIGDALAGTIGGATGKATLAESIFSMLLQLTLRPNCEGLLGCANGAGLLAIGTAMLGFVAIITLGIIATIVETWMQWCFMVAYAFGWFTIPFLLFRQLSFLFDGWLKFFMGVIMFDLVAKITLAIVLLCFKVIQEAAPGSTGATIDVHRPFDLIALFLFIVVGAVILTATGRFATALTAGVSGVTGVMQDMARGTARAFGR